MKNVLQTASIGPIRANIAMFGWPDDSEKMKRLFEPLRLARTLDMSVLLLEPGRQPVATDRKRIDVWWQGKENGALMVLLAYLLTRNWEWDRSEIRLLRMSENEAGRESTRQALQDLLDAARVEARGEALVSTDSFWRVVPQESRDANCLIVGFEMPALDAETEWYKRYADLFADGRTVLLVCSAAGEQVLV